MPDHQARPDTFPRLLLANAERLRQRPAVREKDLGIWQTWTWGEVADEAGQPREKRIRRDPGAGQGLVDEKIVQNRGDGQAEDLIA